MSILWDTDVLSHFFKGSNPHVQRRGTNYLARNSQAHFSHITRYEILRWLKARNATTRLARFESLCSRHCVLELTDAIVIQAADLWASLSKAGQLIGDNDIFIAATALHYKLGIATGNVAHFSRIPG